MMMRYPTKKEVNQMATITATALAEELNTTGREVRKFLRSITPKEDQPGKGSTWAIEKKDIRSLRSKYTKWVEAKTPAPEVEEVEVEAEGPTDAELEAIANEG
jgi:hypothetical protein